MKILSVRQPWTYFIVAGYRDVENRVWSTQYRGPVLIHASLTLDRIPDSRKLKRFGVARPSDADLLRGGIVGMAEIVDCVERSESPWYIRGHFAFVLKRARRLRFKPWRGALGLRNAPGQWRVRGGHIVIDLD